MNILLIGKNGQLGNELSKSLGLLGHLTALDRSELNLNNEHAIQSMLSQKKPQIIVNAAAYTAVDKAQNNPPEAYQINEHAVAQFAQYASENDAILFHYSTDYVFDGNKSEPYLETDPANPINVYGASKLAGEQAIIKSQCRGYIFRTCWLYSLWGHNFVKTVLKLAQQKENLSVVNDQIGVPTSAEFVSDVTLLALRAAIQNKLTPGIYNLTPSGISNWYEVALYILNQFSEMGTQFKLAPSKIEPIASEKYPLPATRPKNSLLDTQKIASCLNITLPHWTVHLNNALNKLHQIGYVEPNKGN